MKTNLYKCGKALQAPADALFSPAGLKCALPLAGVLFTAARLYPSFTFLSGRVSLALALSLPLCKIAGLALSHLGVQGISIETTDPSLLELFIEGGAPQSALHQRLCFLLSSEGQKIPNWLDLAPILSSRITPLDFEALYNAVAESSSITWDTIDSIGMNKLTSCFSFLHLLLNSLSIKEEQQLFQATTHPFLYWTLLRLHNISSHVRAERIAHLLQNPQIPNCLVLIECSVEYIDSSHYDLVKDQGILEVLKKALQRESHYWNLLQVHLFELDLEKKLNPGKEMPWIYTELQTSHLIYSVEKRRQLIHSHGFDRMHQLVALGIDNDYTVGCSRDSLLFRFLREQALDLRTQKREALHFLLIQAHNLVAKNEIDSDRAEEQIQGYFSLVEGCSPSEVKCYNLGMVRMIQIHYQISTQPKVKEKLGSTENGLRIQQALEKMHRELEEPRFAELALKSPSTDLTEQLALATEFAQDKWGKNPSAHYQWGSWDPR